MILERPWGYKSENPLFYPLDRAVEPGQTVFRRIAIARDARGKVASIEPEKGPKVQKWRNPGRGCAPITTIKEEEGKSGPDSLAPDHELSRSV